MQPRSLAEGNRFQRWYHAWATPHYARMEPQVREQAELVDRFLYSRRGLGVWLGTLLAAAGSAAGLVGAGLPLWLALLASALFWIFVPIMGLAVWMAPAAFTRRHSIGRAVVIVALCALAGGLAGFVVGHVGRHGRLDPALLWESLLSKGLVLAPAALAVGAAFAALLWGTAHIRQQVLQVELERARLTGERDASARQAAEARLRLLQGQIQPHFIFNTLSALQHWVDTGDARAPALLRSLTAFLRGSTELLGRDATTVGEETAVVGHYLAIQQARLGARLASSVDVAAPVALQPVPPGLLLTLVENAVEHGVTPSLQGGQVDVRAWLEDDAAVVEVANTGAPLPAAWSEGVGLANCRERLHNRFGAGARLDLSGDAHGTRARVTMPREEGRRDGH